MAGLGQVGETQRLTILVYFGGFSANRWANLVDVLDRNFSRIIQRQSPSKFPATLALSLETPKSYLRINWWERTLAQLMLDNLQTLRDLELYSTFYKKRKSVITQAQGFEL